MTLTGKLGIEWVGTGDAYECAPGASKGARIWLCIAWEAARVREFWQAARLLPPAERARARDSFLDRVRAETTDLSADILELLTGDHGVLTWLYEDAPGDMAYGYDMGIGLAGVVLRRDLWRWPRPAESGGGTIQEDASGMLSFYPLTLRPHCMTGEFTGPEIRLDNKVQMYSHI